MRIIETHPFKKALLKLPKQIKQKVASQLALMYESFPHPSLHIEKLEPREKNLWSFRIDRNYRVIFTFLPHQTLLLLDIGPHDIYKKI